MVRLLLLSVAVVVLRKSRGLGGGRDAIPLIAKRQRRWAHSPWGRTVALLGGRGRVSRRASTVRSEADAKLPMPARPKAGSGFCELAMMMKEVT